jgi:amino acid transporter
MAYTLKRLLVGKAKKTAMAIHERLSKKTGLAVFASDALSSTAYATEEILLVLAVAFAFGQASAFTYVVPITIAIVLVLIIVAISYRQTIFAYPSGGGAYIVAKDNLGTTPGLIAAAALLVDYVLTVSVSISAGVAAITSAAQGTRWAGLDNHKVIICLVLIAFIAVANLRGVRESGALFAGPTYSFVVSFLFMVGYGIVHYIIHPVTIVIANEQLKLAEGYPLQSLSWFLILGAFSNGCVALTGTEAISNGIPAFKQPESKNAATTLAWMAALLAAMFIGTSVMAYLYRVHPSENETVISQFARIIFTGPMGWFYYIIQGTTALILVLAANTSFADFPRLASLLARDRFLPRQFATRGDKLVFSNGIIILAVFAAVLVIAFGGDTSRLIPLYAVGVFLSFTLSQTGMVRHWMKAGRALKAADAPEVEPAAPTPKAYKIKLAEAHEAKHWRKSIFVNGLGAIATLVVLIVLVLTKFMHGAWIVVVLIPLLVALFRAIHRHYLDVARQLTTEGAQKVQPIEHEVIVPISGIHRGVLQALEYAKAIAHGHVTAIYINVDDEATQKLREKWSGWVQGVELVVIASPYRSLIGPLTRYIDRRLTLKPNKVITVVLPEFVPARWWHHLLHNQSSLMLKGALLFKHNVIVISVPYHLISEKQSNGKNGVNSRASSAPAVE